MEDILYHIPGLYPSIVTRIGAESSEQKESIAQSMCEEVSYRYYTKIAYFCCTGKTAELQERFGIKYMRFIKPKKPGIGWICGEARGLVKKAFVRLIVVDCLDSLIEDVPAEEREAETARILDCLKSLARDHKVPVVLLSDHPTEQPCLGGLDLFKNATILSDAA